MKDEGGRRKEEGGRMRAEGGKREGGPGLRSLRLFALRAGSEKST
jgi:hypothetical protein